MRNPLSTFTLALALALASTQAYSASVSQGQPQTASEELLMAANESGSASRDAALDRAGQVPASPQGNNNNASELGGENRQQGVTPGRGTNQGSDLTPPPGAGQGNSKASDS